MSIFSDYGVGALTDDEYKFACAHMNREDRMQYESDMNIEDWYCSECGEIIPHGFGESFYKYCPNCGAELESEG